ncbi:VOC family protein [Cohnella lupini]|uniref:VOC family protein n=1 Tax=Cohnella lupini TaxID=1294267 RepID=UPI000E23D6CA
MPIERIGSLFIQVSHLEKSISFYSDILGLVCRGIEDWGDGQRGATLFCDPHPDQAALLSLAETKSLIPVFNQPLFNFKCNDVPALHEALKEKGCRVTDLHPRFKSKEVRRMVCRTSRNGAWRRIFTRRQTRSFFA